MTNEKDISGVIVPMVTPFTAEGEIDEKAVQRIIDHLCRAGVGGIFVLGTTGEAASVTPDKKLKLVAAAAAHAKGRTKIYAGISDNCFAQSVQSANAYFDLGVKAVVAHVPYFYPLDEYEIPRYFEALADSIGGPLILYNMPITTHMSIPVDSVLQLSRHSRIIGLKDSENNPVRMADILEKVSGMGDFSYFAGCASMSAEALALGAVGIVPSGGNLVPEMYKQLYESACRGDHATAKKLQKQTDLVSKVYQQHFSLGQSLAALKMMMSILKLCGPTMLPPLKALSVQQKSEIIEKMKKLHLC